MLGASRNPRQERAGSARRGRGSAWTGARASLHGPGKLCSGGVFRRQLSGDSRQRSPSNRGCGVPSSLGWEAGREAAGEESEAEPERGAARGPDGLGSANGRAGVHRSTEAPAHTARAERAALPPPPAVCVHAFYASVPRCSALTRGLLFHPLAVLARSGAGALRGWGGSPDVLAPVSPICDAVAGVCGDGLT